ncbi:MAG: patatin family protein [Paraprevotella sp.]|nr:patatin family protein [Paraprevotella sp.]
MEINQKTGLVLEGGGMRGVFTCGVLDWMMDHHLEFPYAIGVSAGACNLLSYISRQRGRAKFSNIDLLEKYKYIGFKYLLTQRSIFDTKLLYEDFPKRLIPFDFATYRANPCVAEMVTTNCVTGRACYLEEKDDFQRMMQIVKASSSLPYVSPIVEVDGQPMLDGGIVDSIPVERAMSLGFEQNVVVLTRNKGYRKTESDVRIPNIIYRKYPRLRVALSHRCECYNKQLELVERLEEESKVIVIRPLTPVKVDRLEKNSERLTALYEEGYACAEQVLTPLMIKNKK